MAQSAPVDYRVVVSHPAKQSIAYHVAYASQHNGIPVTFLTGLYYKPGRFPYTLVDRLPRARAWFARRRFAALDDRYVVSVSGPLPDLAGRVLSRVDWCDAWHDWFAARWIGRHLRRGERVIVHGFIGSCRRTFEMARSLGFRTILEITAVPFRERLLAGAWAREGLRPAYATPRRDIEELELADAIATQSPFAAGFLRDQSGVAGPIFCLPLGVDTELFHPCGDRSRDGFRALFAGTLSLQKGLPDLLRAWRTLDCPGAELVLAGVVSDRCVADILDTGLQRVVRTGQVSQLRLAALYRDCDVFVFLGYIEGGPLVVLEALASGLPCVVAEGSRSVVRDGVEGFVVPNGDRAALADRITRLYHDPDLRRRMSAAARARAEQFTWADYYRRAGRMYRRVASDVALPDGVVDMTRALA